MLLVRYDRVVGAERRSVELVVKGWREWGRDEMFCSL